MQKWGMPSRIKIDNGQPLANAGNRDIPTLTQMWWIGLGIEVNLNTPRMPQQNGTVEGLQGICYRWSAPSSYKELATYQERLNETNRIQRSVYRIRQKGDKTREEIYPELWDNPRKFDPNKFEIQRVFDNLSKRVWVRKIAPSGVVKFWKVDFYIGRRFAHQPVTVTFDPVDHQWTFRTPKGLLLKVSKKETFTENQILQYSGMSKNFS